MKREETIDFAAKTLWLSIAKMYNHEAHKEGMTTSIGYALLNLRSSEGTPATQVAPKMGLEPNSLSRLLKNMEEKGLIYKVKNKEDQRRVMVYLTEEGKRKRKVARQTVLKFNEAVAQQISNQELDVFFKVIGQIQELIHTDQIFKEDITYETHH